MAISSTPSPRPDLRAQLLRALDAETARHFDEAERGYRAVLETDPQNFVALDRLAVMHAGRGELVDALRLIEAAMRANPFSAEIARDMGSVLERMGRLEEAKASFERALALRPRHAGTVYKSAHLLHKLGRYEEALATYDRAAAMAEWRGRIPRDGRLNVGLVWAGGRDYPGDRARTVGFERFAALLGDPRVRYISLHAELRDRDAALMAAHPDIMHFGPELQDFADTAGVISHLDLVISVDTAVAHLASAMAKPVWILLPFSPDFRWLLDRDDSPWYPTARLFRQPHVGDWESVIARVREALASLMDRHLETGA